jgi:hypothetical protein
MSRADEDASMTAAEDDAAARAAYLAQTGREAETLHEHYKATGNPLFVWQAIKLYTGRHRDAALPAWVTRYLFHSSTKLMELGEGIDFTKTPKMRLRKDPSVEDIRAFARQQEEFRNKRSLAPSDAPKRALAALGLAGRQKKNCFTEYTKILQQQFTAKVARLVRDHHELARKQGKTRESFIARETPVGGDRSGTAKQLIRNEEQLKRGEVSIDPFGPERARRTMKLWGTKKAFNSSSG